MTYVSRLLLNSKVRSGLILYTNISIDVLSLRWLKIDFTKCGKPNRPSTKSPYRAHVLSERLEAIRHPVIQAKYLRIGQVKHALVQAVQAADNPYVYFEVRTNGTPWIKTINFNGAQARAEGMAGGYYAAAN